MASQIFEIATKKFIMKTLWSKDWYTSVPWSEDGNNQPYFSYVFEDRGDVHIRVYYVGPIAIVCGNWIW